MQNKIQIIVVMLLLIVLCSGALATMFIIGVEPNSVTLQETTIIEIVSHQIQLNNDPNMIEIVLKLRIK